MQRGADHCASRHRWVPGDRWCRWNWSPFPSAATRSVRTCVYAVPAAGVLPDPETLQVRILPPDGTAIELRRVDGPATCDPMLGGFFFEGDLEPGDRPASSSCVLPPAISPPRATTSWSRCRPAART